MSNSLSDYEKISIRSLIDRTIGEEQIIRFREDFKWLVFENNSRFNRWEEKNKILKKQAYDGLQEARNTNWNKYAMTMGFIGIFLGLLGPLGTPMTIGSIIISFIGGLHKVTVDILVYDQPYREYRNRQLKFMSAWNRGAMTTWKALLILPVGVFNRYTPEYYKIGLWVLDEMMADKYS